MRAYLSFEDGRCQGVRVKMERKDGPVTPWAEADMAELVARGLLSVTDRMILQKIGERVERMAVALTDGTQ
jgi:hypothetical protein